MINKDIIHPKMRRCEALLVVEAVLPVWEAVSPIIDTALPFMEAMRV